MIMSSLTWIKYNWITSTSKDSWLSKITPRVACLFTNITWVSTKSWGEVICNVCAQARGDNYDHFRFGCSISRCKYGTLTKKQKSPFFPKRNTIMVLYFWYYCCYHSWASMNVSDKTRTMTAKVDTKIQRQLTHPFNSVLMSIRFYKSDQKSPLQIQYSCVHTNHHCYINTLHQTQCLYLSTNLNGWNT